MGPLLSDQLEELRPALDPASARYYMSHQGSCAALVVAQLPDEPACPMCPHAIIGRQRSGIDRWLIIAEGSRWLCCVSLHGHTGSQVTAARPRCSKVQARQESGWTCPLTNDVVHSIAAWRD